MLLRLSETGLDSYLVGRGNLNWASNILINLMNIGLCFKVEYQLEYCRNYSSPADYQ